MSDSSDQAHLSIGEVLVLLQEDFPDVTISKIRFLESQGLLDPDRTPSGYRKFFENDIDRLRWILRQQREHFLPLKVIKDRLEVAGGAIPPDAITDAEVSPETANVEDVPATDKGDQTKAGSGRRKRGRRGASAKTPAEPGDTPVPAPASSRSSSSSSSATSDSPPKAELQDDQRSMGESPDVLDVGPTELTLTAEELANACDLTSRQVGELVSFGLLSSRTIGGVACFDADALIVARAAAGFLAHGVEPRHLKRYKNAAQAEAGIYEQVIVPALRQRTSEQRAQARETLRELVALGDDLRAAFLRDALRDHLT